MHASARWERISTALHTEELTWFQTHAEPSTGMIEAASIPLGNGIIDAVAVEQWLGDNVR